MKLGQLGITGQKLVIQGGITLLVGVLLLLFGTRVPEVSILAFLYVLIFSALGDIVMRLFGKQRSNDHVLIAGIKLVLLCWLANSRVATDVPIYLIAIVIGLDQLLYAFINLMTYYLYVKEKVRPRLRYLVDGVWKGMLGITSLFSSTGKADFQLLVMGLYLVTYGFGQVRDGLFFGAQPKNNLKRRVRVSLPLALAALIPRRTLQKINDFLQENAEQDIAVAYNIAKTTMETSDLELLVHVTEEGFGVMGHVDIAYQGVVIAFGNYDPDSESFFGAVGDGVLFKADKAAYIEFCKKETHSTLLGYGIHLTNEQREAVEQQLAEIEALTIPWDPPAKETPTFAFKLRHEIGASLFKFTQSKFKRYFVLSTNCVLLADSIVGRAGTDILSSKGFISPGTYQHYLDGEFEKPNSLVVAKRIYK